METTRSVKTTVRYLRYRIDIHTEKVVTIRDPEGRRLFTGQMNDATARAFIRGHRK